MKTTREPRTPARPSNHRRPRHPLALRLTLPILTLVVAMAACTPPDVTPPGNGVRPDVTSTQPADGETDVFRDATIRLFFDADTELDTDTLTPDHVNLHRVNDGESVAADVSVDAAADAIVLRPEVPLAPNTEYEVEVTSGATDVAGNGFVSHRSRFTTGILFESDEGRSFISSSDPSSGRTNVFRDTSITTVLNPGGVGVDASTATAETVLLYRSSDGAPVQGTITVSGADDSIIFQPLVPLAANTRYTFEVTEQVLDKNGLPFQPYRIHFTTGDDFESEPADVDFTRVEVYNGAPVASLEIGPDGFLYATGLDGILRRWTIEEDGTLGGMETYAGLQGRTMIGIAFDPSDGGNTIWVTHNAPLVTTEAEDFSGSIARITLAGPALANASHETVIEGLPRSVGDHMTNSLRFGPADGALYVTQGSNTGAGAPDSYWGFREERLLSAAVLRIETDLLPEGVLNVRTDAPTNYDPTAVDAPLTIFATGLRNAYDLVWHSNGRLYAPTNGGNGFGRAPGTPPGVEPAVPALEDVETQPDFLFDVVPGGYYGHPNPERGEYVLNGGNPTAGDDPAEVAPRGSFDGYPVGTQPDEDYQGYVYEFNDNASANGAIEYTSGTFGGELTGKLLVVRYAAGGDLLAIEFDGDGDFAGVTTVMAGFYEPLDVIEDVTTGNLYVAELPNWTTGAIQLLRAEAE